MISLLPAFLQPAMSGSAKPKPGAASDSTCSANKLFVYGTLLSGYKPQGPADLVPPNTLQKARLLGGATVRGFEMRDIGQYPCIVTGAKESAVVGEVFELSDPGQWKVLDEYEGISDEIEQPHDYRREVCISLLCAVQG